MTQDEIIRMAQECGDWNGETAEFNDVGLERFAALVAAHEREKLAEQEPVAWMNEERNTITWNELYPNMTPLYAHPVRTKDLTDDEIRFWIGRFPFLLNEKSEKWVIGLARVIIAADREKNK